jgi:hypothetical protein
MVFAISEVKTYYTRRIARRFVNGDRMWTLGLVFANKIYV